MRMMNRRDAVIDVWIHVALGLVVYVAVLWWTR